METQIINKNISALNSTNDKELLELFVDSDSQLDKSTIRDGLYNLEELLAQTDNHFIGNSDECPLEHTFSDGLYVRKILVPKGILATGRIHKHQHHNMIISGKIVVITEERGREILEAPLVMVSSAGTKRGVFALTDTVWVTVHLNPTNTQNIEELEEMIFAEDYEAYEKHLQNLQFPISKLKKKIIKNLSI